MKIVMLSAGAAGRYCGTCLHDNTLAAALVKAGEDVLLVPTYTPLRTDETSVSQSRVFFGGVNVYLQQKSALFRHTPWFLDKLFDSPKLLDWLSQRSSSVDVKSLGELTVSTFQGEDGNRRKELDKLSLWLADDVRPDVLHLTNAMLVGMARQLRQRLNVPIVCSLSGEDIFLEQLAEPHYSRAKQLLRERCRDVDVFVSLNGYFADFMAGYVGIERSKIRVIRHGLNLDGHGRAEPRRSADEPCTIGYFARIAAEKGLHQLVEAFILLCQDPSLPPLKLRTAGYKSAGDEPYLAAIQDRLASAGVADRFEYVGEVDRAGKIAFLQSIHLLSVPTVYHESKGISVIEGLANGLPVVLPSHGTFPELIADTGGGLLCEPGSPQSLAECLRSLILDPGRAAAHADRAWHAIRDRYNAPAMADEHLRLYRELVGGSKA